jgi:protein tyrosine/serine phosphatase
MRRLQICLGVMIVLALIAGPVGYAFYHQSTTRNFRVVHDGVLYRSGQMTLSGLKEIIHDYGIRCVITLRDSYDLNKPPPDLAEEEYCKSQGLLHVRMPLRGWDLGPDGTAPVDENMRKFLAVVNDPHNQPVLVHCFAGIHRTGGYCAVYRMEVEGWSNDEAIAEMKACGYSNLPDEWDILGYMTLYRVGRLNETAVETTPRPVERKHAKKKPADE